MRRMMTVAAAVLGIGFSAAPTMAQSQIEAGTLTCKGRGGVGLVLGSKKSYTCRFAPATGGPSERYGATVTRVGLDLGVTGPTVMVWTVLTAGPRIAPGMLRGSYAGAAADVSVGIGAGAKVLVGGSKRGITLQPLSVQGQGGINLAVGVAGMSIY